MRDYDSPAAITQRACNTLQVKVQKVMTAELSKLSWSPALRGIVLVV